jgi:hypothetical protein
MNAWSSFDELKRSSSQSQHPKTAKTKPRNFAFSQQKERERTHTPPQKQTCSKQQWNLFPL